MGSARPAIRSSTCLPRCSGFRLCRCRYCRPRGCRSACRSWLCRPGCRSFCDRRGGSRSAGRDAKPGPRGLTVSEQAQRRFLHALRRAIACGARGWLSSFPGGVDALRVTWFVSVAFLGRGCRPHRSCPKPVPQQPSQSRRPDGIATASRHSRRGPSVFTSGRSPRTTEIHRAG